MSPLASGAGCPNAVRSVAVRPVVVKAGVRIIVTAGHVATVLRGAGRAARRVAARRLPASAASIGLHPSAASIGHHPSVVIARVHRAVSAVVVTAKVTVIAAVLAMATVMRRGTRKVAATVMRRVTVVPPVRTRRSRGGIGHATAKRRVNAPMERRAANAATVPVRMVAARDRAKIIAGRARRMPRDLTRGRAAERVNAAAMGRARAGDVRSARTRLAGMEADTLPSTPNPNDACRWIV